MPALPWLVGGGAVAAYLFSRGKKSHVPTSAPPIMTAPAPRPAASRPAPSSDPVAPATTIPSNTNGTAAPLPGRWVWPVAMWRDRKPVISDGIGSPRPDGRRHQGVDIMFARKAGDPYLAGTPNGSPRHVMPDNVVAVAAGDGVVWSAAPTERGFAVVIDHGTLKVATFYTHLEKLFVTPTRRGQSGQRVRAGDPIGIVGFDPLDAAKLRHLHFELWRGGPKDWSDPDPLMRSWEAIPDPRAAGVRNASLVYRPVGETGGAYPGWVRELKGKAGVYVIREIDGDIVYVGSSAGRLYDTLTRHLQTWRRWKGFWKGQFGEGHDPGLTYDRDSVEVAVRVTTPSEALDEEMRLIRRLKPRDNLIGQLVDEEVPF